MKSEHQRPASRDERTDAAVRAPTHAERCRTLVLQARSAALSTLARDPEGFPYGSLVTVAIDTVGRPLFLLSTLAERFVDVRCAMNVYTDAYLSLAGRGRTLRTLHRQTQTLDEEGLRDSLEL